MPVPVVDAHHHLWDQSAHDQPWLASVVGWTDLESAGVAASIAPLRPPRGAFPAALIWCGP
jgi:predicted TIM-barrel fold metal-dependent hydrolase